MIDKLFAQLNHQQILFVYEYIKDFKAGPAALRAGYSADSCNQQGATLGKHPIVRACIDYMVAEKCKDLKIDADWVLNEYIKLYNNCNLDDFMTVDEGGHPRFDFSTATREQMAALEGLSIAPGEFGTKIKTSLPAKKALLEQIGKHVNVQAWRDQLKVTGDVSISFDAEDADA